MAEGFGRTGYLASILCFAVLGCSASSATPPPAPTAELAPLLDSLRIEFEVPGLAFALFDNQGTSFEYVGGVKNQDTGEPVDGETVFEAASISKPVFAYVVLSLADEGVIDLDAPIETLVAQIPDVNHDQRAASLTPRLLLSHQGGLPNWRARLNVRAQNRGELFAPSDTLRFAAAPGERYQYSGEGYVLLQRVVEEITGKSLGELARERVFDPLGMSRTSFVFDARSRVNFSHGHNREGSVDKWELNVQLASSTIHTTASDLARFGSHLATNALTQGPFRALTTPAVALQTDDALEHSWGLGLGLVADGPRRYFYHGGNNVIFIADFIYGVDENLGYVLLTNSANGARIVKAVEHRIYSKSLNR